jgi:hypothetical protein
MLKVNDKKLEDDIELLKQNRLSSFIPKFVHDHFKISYNEKTLKDLIDNLNLIYVESKKPNTSLQYIAICFSDAFSDYYANLTYMIGLFEKYKKHSNIVQFRNADDIYAYQSAILMQNFKMHHYDLLHSIYRKVFDIYSMSTDGTFDVFVVVRTTVNLANKSNLFRLLQR